MDLGAATHPGYVRSGNEDGFYASGEFAVFAVADGMGGHEHGEIACHLALDTVVQNAEAIAHAAPTELPGILHQAIQHANTAILSQALTQDARNRMGTTVVVATINGDRLYFAHIGDSRLYLLRGEVFTQLTRDHSLVQTMVDRGDITPEEAAIHPLRHQITRVVGGDDYISPEIASQALEPGDLILLCTDGLSGAAAPETLRAILESPHTAQEKADALVQAALEAGGPDNVTAVVVAYHRPRPLIEQPAGHPHQHPHLSLLQTITLTVVCLLVIALGLAGWSYHHPHYFISVDAHSRLGLYRNWVGLPMIQPERLPDTADPVLMLHEVQPHLDKYGDIHQGIAVENEDTGRAFLQELAKQTVSRLLDDAKTAIEQRDLAGARGMLAHAKALGAEENLVRQLQTLLIQAERTPTPRAPRRTPAPSPVTSR